MNAPRDGRTRPGWKTTHAPPSQQLTVASTPIHYPAPVPSATNHHPVDHHVYHPICRRRSESDCLAMNGHSRQNGHRDGLLVSILPCPAEKKLNTHGHGPQAIHE